MWTQNRIIDSCPPKLSVPPQFFLILFIISHLPNIIIRGIFLVLLFPKPLSHPLSSSSIFIFKMLSNSSTYSTFATTIHVTIICPLDYTFNGLSAFNPGLYNPFFTQPVIINFSKENYLYIFFLFKLPCFLKSSKNKTQLLKLNCKTYIIGLTYVSLNYLFSHILTIFH